MSDTLTGSSAFIARIAELEAINAALVAAAKVALDVLQNMSTEDFSYGCDQPAREALSAAIAKAEAR